MDVRKFILVASAVIVLPASGLAQDVTRYVLQPTADGFVRMDQATGAISICQQNGDNLVCRMAADDRAAYAVQIEELEARVAALEAQIGTGGMDNRPQGSAELPTENEFETTLDYMERFFRRFKGLVDEFSGEQTVTPPENPDRT